MFKCKFSSSTTVFPAIFERCVRRYLVRAACTYRDATGAKSTACTAKVYRTQSWGHNKVLKKHLSWPLQWSLRGTARMARCVVTLRVAAAAPQIWCSTHSHITITDQSCSYMLFFQLSVSTFFM